MKIHENLGDTVKTMSRVKHIALKALKRRKAENNTLTVQVRERTATEIQKQQQPENDKDKSRN